MLGNLHSEEQILNWLYHQVDGDEIEDVTDEMLDMLIQTRKNLAVLFCNIFFFKFKLKPNSKQLTNRR
jgi:hypothetical protein